MGNILLTLYAESVQIYVYMEDSRDSGMKDHGTA